MTPDDLDERLEQLYQGAQSASSEGLAEEALKRSHEGMELLEANGEDTDHHSYSDFVMLTADIHWSAGDYEEAYKHYHRVMVNDPERNDARVATGVALYHLCRFTAAQALLEMCSLDDPDEPEAWYYLGLLALRQDRTEVAMQHFSVANELMEDRFLLPEEIEEKDIVEIVERHLNELPDAIAAALDNVPIILEKRPSEELLFSSDPPMDPTVLGIFDGLPLTEESTLDAVLSPTRIVLFYENIWVLAKDRVTLEEELWITLKHEIGHYFGLSEDDLAKRGLD